METLKTFILKEVKNNLEEKVNRNKIKKSSKQLFEAVTLSETFKKENNLPKIKLSEKAVQLAEKELIENYNDYESDCDCGEGEGKMLRAQLLSIMDNAQKLLSLIKEDDQFEDWIQSKITIAEDYMRVAYSYMTYYNSNSDISGTDEDWDDAGDEMFDDVTEESITIAVPVDMVNSNTRVQPMPEVPAQNIPNYSDALSADVDDDEMFQTKM